MKDEIKNADESMSDYTSENESTSDSANDSILDTGHPDEEDIRIPVSSGIHFRLPTQPPTLESKAKSGTPMNNPERGMFLQNIYDAFVKATGTR